MVEVIPRNGHLISQINSGSVVVANFVVFDPPVIGWNGRKLVIIVSLNCTVVGGTAVMLHDKPADYYACDIAAADREASRTNLDRLTRRVILQVNISTCIVQEPRARQYRRVGVYPRVYGAIKKQILRVYAADHSRITLALGI